MTSMNHNSRLAVRGSWPASAAAAMLLLSSCGRDAAPPPPAPLTVEQARLAHPEAVLLRFSIDGMTCQQCVRAVTEAILQTDGVIACDVSLEDGTAVVVSRDAKAGDRVTAALVALQYKVRTLSDQP